MGHPTVYPTGVTIYDTGAAQNGYTVVNTAEGAFLIDMNGSAHDAPPAEAGKNSLLVEEQTVHNPAVSGKTLLDSKIVEKDPRGETVWSWLASEHFDELGFDEAAKNTLYRLPSPERSHGGSGYWLAIQSVSALGANKWHDAGDERFCPDNVIWSARNANIIGIIDKKTGRVAYRLGPDFRHTRFGAIIGCSHVSLIPKSLPGEGNLLVFDSGGEAGYGAPHDAAFDGTAEARRDYSRVLEINPATFEVEWQYTPQEAGHIHPLDSYKFYSPFGGSAQRLANGNTLICEAGNGRVFEVTREHKTVWEYVSPRFSAKHGRIGNRLSGAFRVSYESAPNIRRTAETGVAAPNVTRLRVNGAPLGPGGRVTKVKGVNPVRANLVEDPFRAAVSAQNAPSNFCVVKSGDT